MFTTIYIWGSNPFTNRLLASHIESLAAVAPTCICTAEELASVHLDAETMVFCDCDKTSPISYCRTLHRPGCDLTASPGITLMNVPPDQDLLDEVKAFAIHGIFYATDNFEMIEKGIAKVLVGEHWLSRRLLVRSLQSVRAELRGATGHATTCMLTLREQEILKLIVAGDDNQTIADQLCISQNTVKTHVSNIYKKIDATNRVQAIIWASKNSELLLHPPVLQPVGRPHRLQQVVPAETIAEN